MSAAAVIVLRRKRLVRWFREAAATVPRQAVTLDQLGEQLSWIFDHRVRHGVFIEERDGRYFMNEQAAEQFLASRRRRALILAWLLVWVLGVILR